MTDDPNMLEYAIKYARRGISVFPIWEPFGSACTCGNPDCASQGKHPIETMVPHGCSDATTDELKIRKWWGERKTANIGIACGSPYFVVDIDVGHGGFESLDKLESEHKIPETVTAKSGGGGKHIFLKPGNAKIKGRIGILPGIDVKSTGGYVVAPPSLHKSGNRYQFNNGVRDIAECPSWLESLINGSNGKTKLNVEEILKGVPHGKRYYTLLSLAGKCRHTDLPFDAALEVMLKCARNCDPPAPESDTRKILEKAYATWEPGQTYNCKLEQDNNLENTSDIIPSKTLAQVATEYLDKIKVSKGAKYVTTGIESVDYAIGGGMDYGEMVIVAARPSHGKSAFALHLLDASAVQGIPTAIVSEEMSGLMLGKRTVQYASDIAEYKWIDKMDYLENEIDKHFAERAPCYVLERCKTADRTAQSVTNLVTKEGVKVVAVDYAQLLGSKGQGRYEQITQTSIALRQLANQTKVALVVLCQLNREIESRDKFIPRLDDLKDSGQLEQDADVVISLVWPWHLDNYKNKQEYQVWINKNRNRQIMSPMVQCKFDPSRQRFSINDVTSPSTIYPERWHGTGD